MNRCGDMSPGWGSSARISDLGPGVERRGSTVFQPILREEWPVHISSTEYTYTTLYVTSTTFRQRS